MTNPLDDRGLKDAVHAFIADAPAPPSANDIINRRAAGNAANPAGASSAGRPRRLAGPMIGLAGVALAVGGFAVWQTSDGGIIVDTPASDTTEQITTTVVENDELATPTTTEGSETPEPPLTAAPAPLSTPPAPPATLPDGRPIAFWAITSDTYELVQVDMLTGTVLGNYGGWGDDACRHAGDNCVPQAIDDIEVGADGRLWIGDCCEPAVGNTFTLEPGEAFVPGSISGALGTSASVSPDGQMVAVATLGSIEIRSTADDQPPGPPLGSYDPGRPDDEPDVWYSPAGWFDDTTLIVQATFETSSLFLVDVSDPANPVRLSREPVGGLLPFADTATRGDGQIVAAAVAVSFTADDKIERDVMGWVFDLNTGERIADFDLPNDTWSIDYDPSGTYLAVIGEEGVARWFGAGESGELGTGFVAVGW